jgi:hypothetical protein
VEVGAVQLQHVAGRAHAARPTCMGLSRSCGG